MKLKTLFFSFWQILTLCLIFLPVGGCWVSQPLVIKSASEDGGRPNRNNSRGIGECDRDIRCVRICEGIFKSQLAVEKCVALDIADVEQMEETVRTLEDPEWTKLEALDLNVLSVLLKISLNPMATAIGRMTKTEKKRFMEWLVIKPDMAKTLEDAETNFEILRELIGSSKQTILYDLSVTISGGENFLTLAMEEKNDLVLNWIHGLFEYACDKESQTEKCILQNFYCQLSLDSDEEEELFDYNFFENTLNEVLVSAKPTLLHEDHWWREETNADDLNRWKTSPHNVCQCLETDGMTCPDEED